MSKVTIVYFRGEGHTSKQAKAVADGAEKVDGVEVEALSISQEGNLPDWAWGDLKTAEAIIYGSPTYMGAPPW